MLIPVMARRRLDYSHLGGGASQSITIEPALSTCGYSVLQLFVRVHERNMVSGQSFVFGLYFTLPSDDDPREFTKASTLGTLSVTSASPAAAPGLVDTELTSPGAYLKIVLTASQTSVPTPLYAELSAVAMLRQQR